MSEMDDLLGIPDGTLARLSDHGQPLQDLTAALRDALDTLEWPGGLTVDRLNVTLADGAAQALTARLTGAVHVQLVAVLSDEHARQVSVRDETPVSPDGDDALLDLMGELIAGRPSASQARRELVGRVRAHATEAVLPTVDRVLDEQRRRGVVAAVAWQWSYQHADRALASARRALADAASHVLDAELAHRQAVGDPDATLAVLATEWDGTLGQLYATVDTLGDHRTCPDARTGPA